MKAAPKKATENIRLKLLAVLSLTTVVLVNALASIVPFNNKSSREIADTYHNLFTPSDITGVILIIIFLSTWAYVIYQFSAMRGAESTVRESAIDNINKYFIANTILNTCWIIAWQFEIIWLAVLIIIAILYVLFRITGFIIAEKLTLKDRLFIQLPFSLYFGWVTFAALASVMTWLVSINWDGFGLRLSIWAVALLIVTAGLVVYMTYRRFDWIYGASIIWAFTGILIHHLSSQGWNGTYPSIITTLVIVLTVLIVVVLYTAEKDFNQQA